MVDVREEINWTLLNIADDFEKQLREAKATDVST